jgi:hypothetical protein
MRGAVALLVSPLVVLGQQSVCDALVGASCRQQSVVALHAVCAGGLAVVLVLTALAWREWAAATLPGEPPPGQAAPEGTRPRRTRRLLAASGTLVGLLSALVAAMMWFPVWALQPCAS